jgi:DNA-binding response OmpR family regulator
LEERGLAFSRKYNAIIVDDEEDVCETLKLYLENMNLFTSIVISGDGMDAIKRLINQRFSVILLDLKIPKKNGFEVLNNICKKTSTNQNFVTSVIISSGNLEKDKLTKALKVGVKHFLVKPFDEEQLKAKVEAVLKTIK